MTAQKVFESQLASNYAIATIPDFLIPRLREVLLFDPDQEYTQSFLSDRADKFIFLLDRTRGEMLKKDPAMQRIKVLINDSPEIFSRILEDRLIEDRIEPLHYAYMSNVVDRAVGEGHINVPITHKSKASFVIIRPYKALFEA